MDLRVVSVKDAFELKANRPYSDHEPGLVVVFDGRQCGFDLPQVGEVIDLMRPDGSTIKAAFTETKIHGEGRSFFFPGMVKEQAPIGTVMYWTAAVPASRKQIAF